MHNICEYEINVHWINRFVLHLGTKWIRFFDGNQSKKWKRTWFGCAAVNFCKHLARWHRASGILVANMSVCGFLANAKHENAGV